MEISSVYFILIYSFNQLTIASHSSLSLSRWHLTMNQPPQNPDDRLVLSRDFTNHSQSMFSLDYELPEDPDLGDWSIDVLYGDDLRQKQRTKFEMLEYVLPTFRVDVDVADVLLPSQRSVAVKVTATQVYGKPVVGQVRVKEFLKAAVGDPQQCECENGEQPTVKSPITSYSTQT